MADSSNDGFDIQKFRSEMEVDYHRASNFFLMLSMPALLNDSLNNDAQKDLRYTNSKLHFDIEKTNLPGINLATDEIRRQGIGNFERKPYVPVFEKLNIVVRSDSNGAIYNFFQSWIKSVINFDTRQGIDGTTGFNSARPYEVNYKKDYVARAEVAVFDNEGFETLKIVMEDAFPIYLGDINLDWSNGNEIIKFPVSLTFTTWYNDTNIHTKANQPTNISGR